MEGRIGKIGFSYHDNRVLLKEILTNYPKVDIVQMQINYLDWNDPAIDAGDCCEVARRHGKQIVMKRVKEACWRNCRRR